MHTRHVEPLQQTSSDDDFAHPIFSATHFRIQTKAVVELKENLTRLVWTGATGAALLGFSRAGKTTALLLMEDQIKARNGHQMPILFYSAHRRDQHTIRALYESIYKHLGLDYRRNEKMETLVANLLMHLAETARSRHLDRVVMLIDEAQRLAIEQIDVFAELDDRLRKEYSIALICLFVGNLEQMGRLLEEVKKGQNEHIEGRFFRQILRFTGLRSVDDVRFCLEQYDQLRFPKKGPTYTEHFLPEAYTQGFRLASLAESMWSEYQRCKHEWHLNDWPMESFIRAVNTLLTDYLHTFGTEEYSAEMFRKCINISGLRPGITLDEDDS